MLHLMPEGPQVNNIKKIQQAIENWEKATRDAFNNASNMAEKQELDAQLKELPNMQRMLTDVSLRKKHAEEYCGILLGKLDPVVKILFNCTPGKKKMITSARLKRLSAQFNLLLPTVQKVFQAKGFEIKETKLIPIDFVLPDIVIKDIQKRFEQLHGFLADNSENKYAALRNANNLYEYLAIMKDGDIQTANTWKVTETDVVREEFDKLSQSHTGSDTFSLSASSIESMASTKVFSSTDSKEKYDNSLNLIRLQPIFDLLRQVPDSIKLEQQFADEIIKKIQAQFPNIDQAIALYNRYSELPQDTQYERESAKIPIICASCGYSKEYDTEEEAYSEKCKSCGAALFVRCPNPKCKKFVPSGALYCSCGQFMKAAMSFGLYCQQFRTALSNLNIDKAEEALARARSSKPDETIQLSNMEKELNQTRRDIQKPIEELERLIVSGYINKAQTALNELHAKRPNVDLQKQQEEINKSRSAASLEFKRCEAETNEGKALEVCVGIVEKYPDYIPAQDWLRRHPPYPVNNVRESHNAKDLTCTLQWNDDPRNRYVTYTIVRKENARPNNSRDGITVAKDLKALIYTDKGLTPGKMYSYAVFSKRSNSESVPAHLQAGVFLLKGPESLRATIGKNACALSWTDVEGSLGVHITRREEGQSAQVVNPCARVSFNDTHLKNGVLYTYELRTLWEYNGKRYPSQDVLTRTVRVEQKPPRVDLSLVRAGEDGNCEVTWKASNTTGSIRIVALHNGTSIVPDQTYSIEQIQKTGRVVANAVPASSGRYSWYADKNDYLRIVAFALFGDDGVAGNTIAISTVQKIIIDEEKTFIQEGTLRLVLRRIPDNTQYLYFLVTKDGSMLTEQSARQNPQNRIEINKYRRDGMIELSPLPENCMLTVSVVAALGNEQYLYFSPVASYAVSNLPKGNIYFRIEWQTAGLRRKPVRKGARLVVSSDNGRIPEMSLCCSQDGHVIMNYVPGMAGIVEIAHVRAQETRPRQEVFFSLDESAMIGIPANADLNLFLPPREAGRYNIPLATITDSRKMPAP